ncbi:hypothetical protein AAFF_G00035740 [Aldrovandia affinis]|uniref:Uncharacterized protein n=1 Tax=Aldrovandia affinis TaxID=143900 RepID=A0AAD7S3F7_9TELE|nr:hypothetical protein AAFF_G00035740 [Aldrovandia affinis]
MVHEDEVLLRLSQHQDRRLMQNEHPGSVSPSPRLSSVATGPPSAARLLGNIVLLNVFIFKTMARGDSPWHFQSEPTREETKV